jgi:hypothetical protein
MARLTARGGTVQRFVMSSFYRPRTDDVTGWLLGEEDNKPFMEDQLSSRQVYRVSGFDFKGNVILWDKQAGTKFLVDKGLSDWFDFVSEPMAGLQDSIARNWQRQARPTDCWFAAIAILDGRTQQELRLHMQQNWNWGDDAFYSINSMATLCEFGEMIGCRLKPVSHTSIDELYVAVNRSPVILGVPEHVVVLYAVTLNKQTIRIWDPANGQIRNLNWEANKHHFDSALCRQ